MCIFCISIGSKYQLHRATSSPNASNCAVILDPRSQSSRINEVNAIIMLDRAMTKTTFEWSAHYKMNKDETSDAAIAFNVSFIKFSTQLIQTAGPQMRWPNPTYSMRKTRKVDTSKFDWIPQRICNILTAALFGLCQIDYPHGSPHAFASE